MPLLKTQGDPAQRLFPRVCGDARRRVGGPPPFHPPPRRLRIQDAELWSPERKNHGAPSHPFDTANPMGIRGRKGPFR